MFLSGAFQKLGENKMKNYYLTAGHVDWIVAWVDFSSKNLHTQLLLNSSPAILLETLIRPMYLGSFVRKHF